MKTWKKVVIAILIFYICLFFMYYILALNSSTGFTQQYKFNVGKDSLIRTVENFKNKNKGFIPVAKYEARDYLDTITKQFVAYIYYQSEDTIVCFYIDSDPGYPNNAYINLLSINEGLHVPQYKLVNKDFDRKKNLEIKKNFRTRFLENLKIEYKDDGNGNFVFWK